MEAQRLKFLVGNYPRWIFIIICIEYAIGTCTENYDQYGGYYEGNVFQCVSLEYALSSYVNGPPGTVILANSTQKILRPFFEKYDQVEELRIIESNITKIIPGFFNSFPNLLVLNFSYNSLENFTEGVFSQLGLLQILDLSHNSIGFIDSNMFLGLHDLHTLDLGFNNFTHISTEMFIELPFLKDLVLRNNFINCFQYINSSVYYLDLSHNNITSVSNFTDLSSLDLSFNDIKDLENIANVVYLNVSHNNLEEVRDPIDSNMQTLDLSYNNISKIGINYLTYATKLNYLSIRHNKLIDMPSTMFSYCTTLKHFDISYNYFNKFEHGEFNNWINIFSSPLLETISIEHNFWTCSDLKEILYISRAKKVEVIHPVKSYNGPNILGIDCIETNKSANIPQDFSVNIFLLNELTNKISELEMNISKLHLWTSTSLTQIENDYLQNIKNMSSRFKTQLSEFTQNNTESIMFNISANIENVILPNITKLEKAIQNDHNSQNILFNEIKNITERIKFLNDYINCGNSENLSDCVTQIVKSSRDNVNVTTDISGLGQVTFSILLIIIIMLLVLLGFLYYFYTTKNKHLYAQKSLWSEEIPLT